MDPDFNLRFLIRRRGLSQRQFAQKLGVAETTVRRWCAGLSRPSLNPEQICLAFDALGCDAWQFREAIKNSRPIKKAKVKKAKD